MHTLCWLKHLCSIRALVPVSCFLSLSLSLFFRLIPWSAEALWVHFPARASKTLLRRHSVPSTHREGTWGLCEQSKPCVRGFIGFLCKPRNISLFISPLLSYQSTLDHQVLVHERTSTAEDIWEMPSWMKHKLDSRSPGEISITSNMQMTPPLRQRLLMKVKEENENAGLKLNIQNTKIMASGPITSWQIDGETMETVTDFIFGLQNHCRQCLQPWN